MATVNKNVVGVGEVFEYNLTLVNQEGELAPLSIENFTVVQGPSYANSMRIINGRMTREESFTYYLKANKKGTYSISPAKARVTTGIILSNTIDMQVVEGETGPNIQGNPDLFTSVSVSKKTVYVGEPIVARFKVYTRFRELVNSELNYPTLEGFYSEQVAVDQNWKNEIINGRSYQFVETKQEVLFPQKAGEIVIDPFQIEATCKNSRFQRGTRMSGTSAPVKITVLPLPSGKPKNFVGTFPDLQLTSKVNKEELSTNEAINLEIKISGKGNLKLLSIPQLDIPSDFETYEPKVRDNISINAAGESGSRTFEFVFIPRSAGEFVIPSTSISYFNTSSKRYETLTIAELKFSVQKGSGDGQLAYTFDSRSEVNLLSQDIRYIKPSSKFKSINTVLHGTPLYFGLMALPLILVGLLIWWKSNQVKAQLDVVGTRQKQAAKVAKRHLGAADALLKKGDTNGFFVEAHRAILSYLGFKLNIDNSELNRPTILNRLDNHISPETKSNLIGILDACEEARFSPSAQANAHRILAEATNLIQQIQKELR